MAVAARPQTRQKESRGARRQGQQVGAADLMVVTVAGGSMRREAAVASCSSSSAARDLARASSADVSSLPAAMAARSASADADDDVGEVDEDEDKEDERDEDDDEDAAADEATEAAAGGGASCVGCASKAACTHARSVVRPGAAWRAATQRETRSRLWRPAAASFQWRAQARSMATLMDLKSPGTYLLSMATRVFEWAADS